MSAEDPSKIYHDLKVPDSLCGVERLLRHAKQLHIPGFTLYISWVSHEKAYTLHKPARRRFIRNHTYVAGIDAQWQADLAYMQSIARQNGEMRYLLTVIDVFPSSPGNAGPLQGRQGNHGGFRAGAHNQEPTPHPKRLQTDKGKEFFKSNFPTLMKRHGIQHVASKRETKPAVVKRFNRTIKSRIWTYLSDRGTVR